MIILDTNVLSEVLRPEPHPLVSRWLDHQPAVQLFTTTVTRAEILFGISLLPNGQRRRRLLDAALAIFDEDLRNRVLAFDSSAADAYARIGSARRASGRPISQFDCMIAGIAYAHGARLATRNTRDFADCEIDLVDPWRN